MKRGVSLEKGWCLYILNIVVSLITLLSIFSGAYNIKLFLYLVIYLIKFLDLWNVWKCQLLLLPLLPLSIVKQMMDTIQIQFIYSMLLLYIFILSFLLFLNFIFINIIIVCFMSKLLFKNFLFMDLFYPSILN